MVSPIYHQRHLAHPSWILSSKTIRTRKSSSPWSYSPLLTPHMDTRVFRRIFGNRVRIRGKSIEGCGCSDKAAYKSATRRDEVRTQREEGGGNKRWRDGRMEEGRVGGSRLGKKREERGRGGGLKGCWRRAMRKARERERGRGREEGRNWGTVLSMHSGETRTLHFPPPLLLLPPLKLPHTSHSLAALFHEPNRFRSYIPLPSPSPSRPTCIRIHTRIHTLYVCIHVWVTRAGGAGGTIIQHPTLDPLIIHTCIHTYNTYTYTWAKLTFAYQRDRSPPTSTVSATFFFFVCSPGNECPTTSPPLLPLPLTSSSGIIDFAWRPDSRIRSAGTRC